MRRFAILMGSFYMLPGSAWAQGAKTENTEDRLKVLEERIVALEVEVRTLKAERTARNSGTCCHAATCGCARPASHRRGSGGTRRLCSHSFARLWRRIRCEGVPGVVGGGRRIVSFYATSY
jgi:uncharacterized small protein (DUF1192 family)